TPSGPVRPDKEQDDRLPVPVSYLIFPENWGDAKFAHVKHTADDLTRDFMDWRLGGRAPQIFPELVFSVLNAPPEPAREGGPRPAASLPGRLLLMVLSGGAVDVDGHGHGRRIGQLLIGLGTDGVRRAVRWLDVQDHGHQFDRKLGLVGSNTCR